MVYQKTNYNLSFFMYLLPTQQKMNPPTKPNLEKSSNHLSYGDLKSIPMNPYKENVPGPYTEDDITKQKRKKREYQFKRLQMYNWKLFDFCSHICFLR